MEQQINKHWHLKREVPVATIITLLGAIAIGTLWLGDMRKDVDLHWQSFTQHVELEAERIDNHKEGNKELLAELRSIKSDVLSIKLSLAANHIGRGAKR